MRFSPRRAGRPAKGMTLLEIMMVMTLAGLMLGVVAPRISRFQSSATLDSASYELARDLGRARMEAVRLNQKLIVTRYADTAYQVGDEAVRRLPKGVHFHEAQSAESITFMSLGLVADGASQFRLGSGTAARRVVLRGSGHVSVQ